MDNKLSELVKASKFAIVGVANTLIDMGLFALLTQIMGWGLYLSQVISYSAGVLNSYICNRSWTFATHERFWSPTLVKFIVTNTITLGISTALLWLFHEQLGLVEMLAKCGSVAITLAVNFIINRLWVFSS